MDERKKDILEYLKSLTKFYEESKEGEGLALLFIGSRGEDVISSAYGGLIPIVSSVVETRLQDTDINRLLEASERTFDVLKEKTKTKE